jgi:hypothetical protein
VGAAVAALLYEFVYMRPLQATRSGEQAQA